MSSEARAGGDGLRLGFIVNLFGRGAVMASGAAVSLILARHYGAETFGRWSVATAFATMVGTVLDGGLHRLLMRDVGREPDAARTVLLNVVKQRLRLAAGAVPLALLIAWLTLRNFQTWVLVALLVLARLIWDVVSTFSSVLYAFDRFRLPNVIETIRRSLLLAVVVVLVMSEARVEWVALATLVLTALGSTAVIRPALQLVANKTKVVPPSRWSDAAWFWVNGVLFWINAEVDQIMMAWLADDYQVGIYAAAVRLVMICLVIPRAVNDTVVRRWFKAGDRPDRQMAVTTMMLSAAGGILGLQFVAFARDIIALVYSARYLESAPSFAVLGWFLFLHFARSAPSWFLATSDRVPLSTAFFAVAAVLNIVANMWLIPAFGALGAAYSTTACELVLLCLAYGAIGRRAPALVISAAVGVMPAVVAAGVALLAHRYVSWYVASVAGMASGAALLGILAARAVRNQPTAT